MVLPSLLAAQTHPKYWPDEPTTWNPRRWVETATPSGDAATTREEQLAREEIMEPRAGAYFPWSAGVQNCAGRKFAQVEIVAAMAALFREYRMRPVLLDGEDFEKAQARILKSTNDSYQLLVMQMRDPDSTQFVWEKVE